MQSMTGYGRHEEEIEGFQIAVEIKSVNSRYSEYAIIVPRFLGFLEERVRKYLQKHISRGKISVYVSVIDKRIDSKKITLNGSLAGGYIGALRELCEVYGLSSEISLSTVTRFNDIFVVDYAEQDEDELFNKVCIVMDKSLEKYLDMRRREGGKLKADMVTRRDVIGNIMQEVEIHAPQVIEEHTQKMKNRIAELLGSRELDETRMLTEIAIISDKLCIAEEIVRMKSHLQEFDLIFTQDEPVGRKLDFLLQEMNREVNTMGSKINDLRVGKRVVEMKTELEKIREQLQNIE